VLFILPLLGILSVILLLLGILSVTLPLLGVLSLISLLLGMLSLILPWHAYTTTLPVFYSGGYDEAWEASSDALVDGFYVGIFVAFPCALVVLLLATRNVLLSAYAMTTIVGIVATLLSFVSAVVQPPRWLHLDCMSHFVDRWVTNLVWWKQSLL